MAIPLEYYNIAQVTKMAGRLIGKIILLLIALVFLLFWKVMYCGFFPSTMSSTEGVILSSCYSGKMYEVVFEYYVGSKKFISNIPSCGSNKCNDIELKYKKGTKVAVYYNEKSPRMGVLEPIYRISDFYIIFIIIGLILVLCLVLVISEKKVANELFFNE